MLRLAFLIQRKIFFLQILGEILIFVLIVLDFRGVAVVVIEVHLGGGTFKRALLPYFDVGCAEFLDEIFRHLSSG